MRALLGRTRCEYRSTRRRIGMLLPKGSRCRPGFGSSSSSLLCWPSLATLAGDASLGSRPVLALFRWSFRRSLPGLVFGPLVAFAP
jgi:hypothetical protein